MPHLPLQQVRGQRSREPRIPPLAMFVLEHLRRQLSRMETVGRPQSVHARLSTVSLAETASSNAIGPRLVARFPPARWFLILIPALVILGHQESTVLLVRTQRYVSHHLSPASQRLVRDYPRTGTSALCYQHGGHESNDALLRGDDHHQYVMSVFVFLVQV